MLSETAHRAEAVITAKIRHDAGTAGPRTSLGAETGEWGRTVALRVPGLRDLAFYNKARGVKLTTGVEKQAGTRIAVHTAFQAPARPGVTGCSAGPPRRSASRPA